MKDIELIHGDCYEEIKKIPDKSIDLVYIDIPYLFEHHGGSDSSPVSQRIRKMGQSLEHISNGIDLSILDELTRVQKYIYIYMV